MNSAYDWLLLAVRLSGAGLALLVIASPAIPIVLQWSDHVRCLPKLTRQVFWTYSTYIWLTNAWFASLALLLPRSLLSQTPLAAAITGFIAFYWLVRIALQFLYFDRTGAPSAWYVRAAETALLMLFAYVTLAFSAATAYNLGFV